MTPHPLAYPGAYCDPYNAVSIVPTHAGWHRFCLLLGGRTPFTRFHWQCKRPPKQCAHIPRSLSEAKLMRHRVHPVGDSEDSRVHRRGIEECAVVEKVCELIVSYPR